jgi:ribosomal protein S20
MLRNWLKSVSNIESMTRGTRKKRLNNACQESEMKTLLLTQFNEARKSDRKVIKRWFTRHVKKIYEELYPHRVIKRSGKSAEYSEFRFSHDWFMSFKKRSHLSVRCRTKMSQMIRILITYEMIYDIKLILTSLIFYLDFEKFSISHRQLIAVQSSQFSITFGSNSIARWREISIMRYWKHGSNFYCVRILTRSYVWLQRC